MSLLFEIERLKRIRNDVAQNVINQKQIIKHYKMYEGMMLNGATVETTNWKDYDIDTPWTQLDSHRWFRTTITIPHNFNNQYVELNITTGREDQWDATNPQMLCYLNGNIQQGVDVNHHQILINTCAQEGQQYELALYAYSGSVAGDLMLHTALQVVDQPTQKFYYDFSVLVDTAMLIQTTDERNCRTIIQELMKVVKELDLRETYSETYYQGIKKATEILTQAFYTNINEQAPVVSAIGHTHIDIAWLWTFAQTREKAVRSFATVLNLMDRYPDYKFMSSQPILYQFVKEDAPELYKRIKERVAEGRWEVDGAMWLESDCNIPNGESLVRQILKGHNFMLKEFGIESKSLWLPDVFGYSAAIPQILKKMRIPYFATTKIAWNQYNQLPNDTFLWKGIDGSQVFVYMPTTSDYNKDAGFNISFTDKMNTTTYTGIINPNMTLGTYQRFQNKDLSEDTLMLYGYGDGGGGPTSDMLEQAQRLAYGLPGLPRIKMEFEGDFLDRTYKQVMAHSDMPTWDGELYFEYHRGTYTSIGKNKLLNRRSENLYEQLEILSAMVKRNHEDKIQEVLKTGWEIILLNQFHDIIPGSSIKEVYEDTDQAYSKILKKGEELREELLENIREQTIKQYKKFGVVNTMGYGRSGMVKIREKAAVVTDKAGVSYPVQQLANGEYAIWASDVPGLGVKAYQCIREQDEEQQNSNWQWTGSFSNAYYSATFNKKMELTSLIEKENNRELLKEGRVGNELILFEDRPMNWDNWDVDVYYQRKRFLPDEISTPKVTEAGPVRYTIQTIYTYGKSIIRQSIHMYPDSPRIDFENKVDWNTHHVLLKTKFPVNINARKATYEIQYGNVERETTNNNSWDQAKFEVCGHKWMDFSEDGVGISLLNDCKYGYSAKDGEMALTLIKAGTYPNEVADIGEHNFTYSIYPHNHRWKEARTVEEAYDLNVPMLATTLNSERKPLKSTKEGLQTSYISCNQGNCFIETIKAAEDGQGDILRMYENKNRETRACIRLPQTITTVYEVNLLEEFQQEIKVIDNEVEVIFAPYEIKSIRLI